jgi:broad-specificity NMP kinase
MQRVEARIEERGYDTKAIWEKALAQIMEVNQQMATLNRKIDVFSSDLLNMRASQLENEERFRRLEADREGSITTIQ